jgi:hypothetical protein
VAQYKLLYFTQVTNFLGSEVFFLFNNWQFILLPIKTEGYLRE